MSNVLAINPVNFLFNHQSDTDTPNSGFIAQEVFPGLVTSGEHLSLSTNMNAYLVKSIQELHAIIQTQAQQISELQKAVLELQK